MFVYKNLEEAYPTIEDIPADLNFVKRLLQKPQKTPALVGLNLEYYHDSGLTPPDQNSFKAAQEKKETWKFGISVGLRATTVVYALTSILYLFTLPVLFFIPTNFEGILNLINFKKGPLMKRRLTTAIEMLQRRVPISGGSMTQRTLVQALGFYANYVHIIDSNNFGFNSVFEQLLFGERDFSQVLKEVDRLIKMDYSEMLNLGAEVGDWDNNIFDSENSPFCTVHRMHSGLMECSKGQGELAYWRFLHQIKEVPEKDRTSEMLNNEKILIEILGALKPGDQRSHWMDDNMTVRLDYRTSFIGGKNVLQTALSDLDQIVIDDSTMMNMYDNITSDNAMDQTPVAIKSARIGMEMYEGKSKADFRNWHAQNLKYFVGERNVVINRKTKAEHILTNRHAELFKKYISDPAGIRDDVGLFSCEAQMVGCLRELDVGIKSGIVVNRALFAKEGKVKKKTITWNEQKYEETVDEIPITTGLGVVMLKRASIHEFFNQCMIAWAGDHGFAPTRKYLESRLQDSIIRVAYYQHMLYPKYDDTLPIDLKDNNTLCQYFGAACIKRHQNFGLNSTGILHAIEKARNVTLSVFKQNAINALKKRITNENQAKLVEMHVNGVPMPTSVTKALFRSFFVIPAVQNGTYRSAIYMPKLFYSPYGHYLSFHSYYEKNSTVVINTEKNITWRDLEYLIMTSFYLDDVAVMKAGIGKVIKRADIKNLMTSNIRLVTDKEFAETTYIPPLRGSGNATNKFRGQVLPVVRAAVKRKIVGELSIFEEDIKSGNNQVGGGYETYESVFKKLMKDVEEAINDPKDICAWVNDKVVKITPVGEFFASDYKPKKARMELD